MAQLGDSCVDVSDEYGERWSVERGDSASAPLSYLIRHGLPLRYIIMPRIVLMFGSTGSSNLATMEAGNDDIDAYCRYWDCVEMLKNMEA